MTMSDIELAPIGEFVRQMAPEIGRYCEAHPDELDRLQDIAYARSVFRISSTPVLKDARDFIAGSDEDRRYYKGGNGVLTILGVPYRLTSQWVSPRNYQPLVDYLRKISALSEQEAATLTYQIKDQLVPVKSNRGSSGGGGGGRKLNPYKAVGDIQNTFVRNVLSRLAPPSPDTWTATKAWFGDACAYCNAGGVNLTKDHAIAMNMQSLGEHVIGNLVPACRSCNQAKAGKDFDDWLLAFDDGPVAEAKIARIRKYMSEHGYVPLRLRANVAEVQSVVSKYRLEIKTLADDCISELEDLL